MKIASCPHHGRQSPEHHFSEAATKTEDVSDDKTWFGLKTNEKLDFMMHKGQKYMELLMAPLPHVYNGTNAALFGFLTQLQQKARTFKLMTLLDSAESTQVGDGIAPMTRQKNLLMQYPLSPLVKFNAK